MWSSLVWHLDVSHLGREVAAISGLRRLGQALNTLDIRPVQGKNCRSTKRVDSWPRLVDKHIAQHVVEGFIVVLHVSHCVATDRLRAFRVLRVFRLWQAQTAGVAGPGSVVIVVHGQDGATNLIKMVTLPGEAPVIKQAPGDVSTYSQCPMLLPRNMFVFVQY